MFSFAAVKLPAKIRQEYFPCDTSFSVRNPAQKMKKDFPDASPVKEFIISGLEEQRKAVSFPEEVFYENN